MAADQDDVQHHEDAEDERQQRDVPSSIWPGFSTLNQAPMPTEFRPSLACVLIHWESKLDCDR